MHKGLQAIALLLMVAALVCAYSFAEALRDPVVRRASVTLPDWPQGARAVRVVLLSDIHIRSAAMDQRRLARIVGKVNALKPDLVMIAGDFIFGHDPDGAARFAPSLAPLASLRAPLGVVAVAGNHDHWTGLNALRSELSALHVTLLANSVAVRGPLAIAGIDDNFSKHDDIAATISALNRVRGARVALTHSPDIAPKLPAQLTLLLAGHTHCGQVVLPFIGPVSDVSRYGARYRCGMKQEGRRKIIVTGGLGTSGGPFRLGAPPDLWLITLGS